jgi:protein pelota
MQIIKLTKEGELVFVAQTIEDLWAIKTVANTNDVVSGLSYRRQKGAEETNDSERKPVFVHICIEKYDFSQSLKSLRFTGRIIDAKPLEFAPIGDYHTLEVQLNKSYTLKKEVFFKHQIDLLEKTSKTNSNVLVIVLDDECANIYKLSDIGVNDVATINSGKTGKRYSSNFNIKEYFLNIEKIIPTDIPIIVAGCGYTKKQFVDFIKPKIKKEILEVNIQNTSRSSISELFKKPEVSKFFENSIIYKEQKIFDLFLENLGKDNNKAIYGLKQIKTAIEIGAIETILVSEKLWQENLNEIQEIVKNAEKVNAKVHIVDSKHEISRSLNSFSGVVANLRFAINI